MLKKQVINLIHPKVTRYNFMYKSLRYFGKSIKKLASFLMKQGIHTLFNTIHALDKYLKTNSLFLNCGTWKIIFDKN